MATCQWAVARLATLPGMRLLALSRWFRTRPVPPGPQPDYINGMALLAGRTGPATLLAALQAIEAEAGRVRSIPNAARTLDLDIAAMDSLVRTAPDPVLPHPRLPERAFVLLPMADLAPAWRHPVSGRTVAAMLAALPPDPGAAAPLPACSCMAAPAPLSSGDDNR